MTTIGIIGIENSHVDNFVRHLNVEQRHPDVSLTTLVGGDPERREALVSVGGGLIADNVQDATDLIGKVDAAIICSRDGATHAAQAIPLLRAGMPVLVDKPLATTVADATAMIAVAKENNALLLSSSALRHVPEMTELCNARSQYGPMTTVHVVGPADPDSEYSGLAFYGIHEIEAALEICGNERFGDVHVQRVDHAVLATTTIGQTNVTLGFVTPDHQGRVEFHASVAGRHGYTQSPLSLVPDYNAPMLAMFVEMIETGLQPISDEHLLRPIELLEAITDKLQS